MNLSEIAGTVCDFINRLGLYSQPLSLYLWGYDCSTGEYSLPILYNLYGFIALVVALVLAAIYYYAWKPVRRQRMWWFVLLGANGLVQWCVAYFCLTARLDAGRIGECLVFNDSGTQVIDRADIAMFGVVNAVVAMLLFFVLSLVFKSFSSTCRHYPF